MGYDFNTRKEYEERKIAEFKKSNFLTRTIMSIELKVMFEEIILFGSRESRDKDGRLQKFWDKNYRSGTLLEFMKSNCKGLVKLFVNKEYIDDYYYMVDQMIHFPYTRGYNRRTVRCDQPEVHYFHALELLYSYMAFSSYGVSLTDFIKDRMPSEELDYKRNDTYFKKLRIAYLDEIIAARIDQNDVEVIETIKEALLSENNTTIVTTDLIRSIVKSKNEELQNLLASFLLAASSQEGARQAVCENADCGREQAFKIIMNTIKEGNLLRFSSVKRAIATYTGLFNDDVDRITEKSFVCIYTALNDLDEAKRMTRTEDSVQIIIGLWALGFYEVTDAISQMKWIVANGSKNQLLAISYYNYAIQFDGLKRTIAQSVFETYPEDLELHAAFMNCYMDEAKTLINNCCAMKESSYGEKVKKYVYYKCPLNAIFSSEIQARKHYEILKNASQMMTKKDTTFSPIIFPWYSIKLEKGEYIIRMALIAYALEDQEMIDEVCGKLSDIVGTYSSRSQVINLLLHDPKTQIQKNALIMAIADKETYSRNMAFSILQDMKLTNNDYEVLEGYLKYKLQDLRKNVIELLEKRDESGKMESVQRMLQSKDENIRLGALDILKNASEREPEKKSKYRQLLANVNVSYELLSEKEKILFDEINGEGSVSDILSEKGFGLYDPDDQLKIPEEYLISDNGNEVSEYFSVKKSEIDNVLEQFDDFVILNGKKSYRDVYGEEQLLMNNFSPVSFNGNISNGKEYPFPELWEEFYDKYIHDERLFFNVYMALMSGFQHEKVKKYDQYLKTERKILGDCGSEYHHVTKLGGDWQYPYILLAAFQIMELRKGLHLPKAVCLSAMKYIANLPENLKWYEKEHDSRYSYVSESKKSFISSQKMSSLFKSIQDWKDDDSFTDKFWMGSVLDSNYNSYTEKNTTYFFANRNNDGIITMYDYMKAYRIGLIQKEDIYQYAFDKIGISTALAQLNYFMSDRKLYPYLISILEKYMKVDNEAGKLDKEDDFCKLGQELYLQIVDKVLSVELKRGDTPTIFSKSVSRINVIYGMDNLFAILASLGKDTLDRSSYYYYSGVGEGKKQCLSHLLQVCYPINGDTSERMAEYVKKYKISEERLIEVAMYASQWLDLIEEYLGVNGLKRGCYYFMAHMNESFDEKKKAMIAKYTPLTVEELNDGCFDVEWFEQSYEQLGEKTFAKLYAAAKYISDGSKHTRARKYADAALGKVSLEKLEEQILDKRNKDLLMSYGLAPIVSEEDQLHRYEFIQKYLKDSKQFGAQRRASESKAAEVALKNLATRAGYADDLRLILSMETALVTSQNDYFEGVLADEYILRIEVLASGKAELAIYKEDKKCKTVPATLKKNEKYLEIKEFTTKLKNQYSRCVKMFENSMEEQDVYSIGEMRKLMSNPVTKEILEKLLFVELGDNLISLLKDLINTKQDDDKVKIAHPYDLYMSKEWATWQKYFFDLQQQTGERQPFKQVFRELYVKLDEEKDAKVSRMFAGNQIQPKKTVGVLKNRRWVADYENGIQKIYYKHNIIATIYAMADWFSPADTEEPTLEYVCFYDRQTFEEMKISDIPEIVYSEVMRDVDLAVSVAHAGGVDPMASHSTIEMRKVIFEFNLQLFKLDNVKLEENHAFITGKYGEYTVHLGSGVIHKIGGHQVNVLPVHSQNRGKIFLPFVDDDPKTAEIMSKILLFAQDNKIKDPYIMEQIL